MAYDRTDIARSIRRYLTLMLDEKSGWTTRIARRMVADDDRPVAVILLGETRPLSARSTRDQGNVTEGLPVTIYAYPEVGEDEQEATVAADAILQRLKDALLFGLSPSEEEIAAAEEAEEEVPWATKAGPLAIPLWDYSEVPLTGAERAGPKEPHDVIWVDEKSLSAQNLEDPQDGKRRTVVIEFRASIERPGRTAPQGLPVGSLPGGFKAPA